MLNVQNAFLLDRGNGSISLKQHLETTSRHQNLLESLRRQIEEEICTVNKIIDGMEIISEQGDLHKLEQEFCKNAQIISEMCCSMMMNFARTIVEDSVKVVGTGLPPCSFEVVAIGSMARGEMTPYSDLEYLFLVADNSHMEYFHTLAVVTYFLIANLGETNLKYMNISELKDQHFIDQAANGFKIDGLGFNAGNIPTGNGLKNSKQLILTAEELYELFERDYMVSDTSSKPTEGSTIVGSDLSQMLSNCISIFRFTAIRNRSTGNYNDKSMLGEFHDRVRQLTMSNKRKERTIQMMKGDASKYTYLPTDFRNPSGWLKVKADIYRYPTIMLNSLKILCEVNETNVWRSIELLSEKLSWTPQTIHGMRFLVASSIFLRLEAYLFYNKQSEDMTLLSQGREILHYKLSFNLFHSVGSFLFPLKRTMQKLLQSNSIQSSSFRKLDFCKDQMACYITLAYCQQWEQALNVYKQNTRFGNLEEMKGYSVSDIPVLTALEYCAFRVGNYTLATGISKIILELIEGASTFSEIEQADRLNCIAANLRYLTRFKEANQFYSRSLKIYSHMEQHSDEIKLAVARTMNFTGRCLSDMGKYPTAQRNLVTALEVQIEFLGEKHAHVGHTHNNLGNLYSRMADYDEAEHHYTQTLEIRLQIHGRNTAHHDIAIVQHNMADSLQYQGKFKEAIRYYETSLDIYRKLYGEHGHEEIGCIQNQLARCLCHEQMRTDTGLIDDLLSKSMVMLTKLYRENGIEHHTDMAECYLNLAVRKAQKRGRGEFEKLISQAQSTYRSVYGKCAPHINIVNCTLTHAAIMSSIFGDDKARRSLYCKACRILKRVFPGKLNAPRRKRILSREKFFAPAAAM